MSDYHGYIAEDKPETLAAAARSIAMLEPRTHQEAKDVGPTEIGCTTSEAIDTLHAGLMKAEATREDGDRAWQEAVRQGGQGRPFNFNPTTAKAGG